MDQNSLHKKLKEYSKSDFYPFHMPGHKRNGEPPYNIDITEIDGFDDLHHPEGILKERMEYAAKVFQCEKLYYLVNGSTCGNLAAISAVCEVGSKVIVARNCHKSVYHAIYLRNLSPVYLYPDTNPEFGFFDGLQPRQVEEAVRRNPDAKAVVLTSPTYEGIVSDIGSISRIVHEAGMLLIVDEAHGAHFGFGKCFFPSAIFQGADIVINSVHKTLCAMTQTAIMKVSLHVEKEKKQLLEEKIEKFLHIYESSSPSYVLMASIDDCVSVMDQHGEQLCLEYEKRMKEFYAKIAGIKNLKVARLENQDMTKVVISLRGMESCELSGADLSDIFRKRYHLEMEMEAYDYVIAMTSIFDREEGLKRLAEAIIETDAWLGEIKNQAENGRPGNKTPENTDKKRKQQEMLAKQVEEMTGKSSTKYVYVYPPGIPILVPGEVCTTEIAKEIIEDIEKGLNVRING